MSQQTPGSKLLLVQFTYIAPSQFNGHAEGEKNQLAGMFAVEATMLRSPREVAALAGIRLEGMLAMLLEEAAKVTELYNAEHPLPEEEEQPAEGQEEEVDFQA